jgi:hypothetical protein
MGAELPGLNISPTWFWCGGHLEAFRARWPHGYLTATLYLLEHVLDVEEIQHAADRNAFRLEPTLMEFGPICCYLARRQEYGEEWLAEVVRRALVMDPKLQQAIKERQGARKAARLRAEKEHQRELVRRGKKKGGATES